MEDIIISFSSPTSPEISLLLNELSATLENKTGSSGVDSFTEWKEGEQNFIFIKAMSGDQPVGCGGYRPTVAGVVEIKRMFSRFPGKGIGKRMLEFLEKNAAKSGVQDIILETRKMNKVACDFYLNNGYSIIENYGRYAGRQEAICFGKKLLYE